MVGTIGNTLVQKFHQRFDNLFSCLSALCLGHIFFKVLDVRPYGYSSHIPDSHAVDVLAEWPKQHQWTFKNTASLWEKLKLSGDEEMVRVCHSMHLYCKGRRFLIVFGSIREQ